MSNDEYERIARELQVQPYPHGPLRDPPAWRALTANSKAYWIAKARSGERPRALAETPRAAATGPRPRAPATMTSERR